MFPAAGKWVIQPRIWDQVGALHPLEKVEKVTDNWLKEKIQMAKENMKNSAHYQRHVIRTTIFSYQIGVSEKTFHLYSTGVPQGRYNFLWNNLFQNNFKLIKCCKYKEPLCPFTQKLRVTILPHLCIMCMSLFSLPFSLVFLCHQLLLVNSFYL